MHLSRGSFGKIELTDNLKDTMTLSELLAEGHAFAAYGSGKVENGYVQKLNNIKVIEHEHDTSSGPCVCGYTCDHSNGFTDEGKCKDCGYVCTHTNVGDDGKCAVCGTAMVAKVEVGETITYASDLAYALNNAVNGATITLLTDTELSAYVNIYDKTMTSADQMVVTLDLAGHTVTSSKPIVIGADRNITASYYGTLKIVGSGNITLNYAVLNAREKGVLDLSGWEDGAISSVTVTRNGNTNEEGKLIVGENAGHIGSLGFYNWTSTEITNTKLYGGSYGEISTSGSYTVSLAGLLPAGYAFKNTDGSFADATASKLYGVTVSACDHNGANGFDYKANACPYCGAPAVAYTKLKNVEDNPWRNFADLQTAIDVDRDGGSVLQLLADVAGDYTIDGTQDTGLDLSGYHINGTLYVKGTKGDFITTTLSNPQNTVNVGIDKVVAFDGAELAGSRYPAVIGELTLADGATWENILNLKTLGYKVLNADGSYKWYAPADITDRTTLNNVIINSLPITSKNLSFKVNGKNVTGNKVERGTTVQLCAYCNTSGATVTFYVKGPDDDGYARHMSEYKKIGSTSYYVTEYTFNKTGTYDIYFYASKDGYSVSSADKTLTVSLPNLSKAKITFTNGNESAYEPYNSTTGAPPYTVTYNDKVLTEDVDYTVTGDSSEYDAGRTCTLTITAVDGSGYTGKKTARWKIVPHKVKLSVGDVIKNYDGTTDLPDGKISLVSAGSAFTQPGRGLPLTAGNGYELIDAGYDSANASETEKTVSFTVKLTDKNYTFEDGTKEKNFTLNGAESDDKTFKINPATIDLSKIEFTQIIYNDLAKTYEIDLNPLLAELLKQQKPAGVEYGSIKYQACNYAFNPSDYLDGTTVSVSSDGILSLPIASAHTAAVGTEIGTLDVNVNTTNYGLFQLPIKVKIGEKITPVPAEGFSASATDITYGQTVAASTLTVTGSMKDPRTGGTVNGTFEWKDGTVKPNAGSYDAEWTFTPAAGYEEYAQTNGNVTVKVNRKDIAGAIVTLEQDSFVYDGKRKDPVVKSVVLDGVTLAYGKNNDYGCMYNATEKVGTYNDFYINGHGNYTGQISVTWSITAREVTPEIDVASCSYTGDALEPTVTLTDDLGNTIDPSEYSVTYSNNTNAGKGLVSIKDVEGGNYVIKAKSQDFPIDQAAAPEATPGTLNVINGTMLTYTYDFKPLLQELTKGEYGTIRYNLSAVSLVQNSGYYLDQTTVEFDDGVLILASLYAKDGTMTDEIGTVKVNVATDNYRSFELTLTLNAVNQIKPTADGTVTASAITYGQTLSESTISGKMKDPATGETVNGTFAWKNGTAKPNAGNYDAEWTFTPAAGYEKYAAVTDTATVEVNRKDIAGAKVTLKSDSFVYDGTRKIPEAESVVLDGVTLEYGEYKDYVCGYSSGANVATYEFTVIGYNNYIGNVTVTWSITAREVTPTVTVADGEYVYDGGREIKPNVTVRDGDTVIDPTEYDVSYSNNTNAGTGKMTVTDKDGGNYVIGTADTTFAISKADAPVDMQSGALTVTNATTQNYTYDFKQLLPAAPGGDYGAVSYTLQLPFDTPIGYAVEKLPAGSGEYTFENGVLDMNFTTPFEKKLQKTGRIGAIKVTVTTDNYKDFELTLDLCAVNKIKLVPGTVNCTEITYGDKLGNSVITGVMYAEDDAAKTTPISGKFEWDSTDITPVNGDEVAYVFIPDEANKYETYTGYVNIKVNPKNIAGAKITLKSDSFVYDGTTRIPEAESVVLDGVTLEYGTDYDCGYTNGKDVGTYEFYVTGYNNYTGRVTVKWSITTREVTPTVTVDDGEYVYDEGKEIKPNVTVKDGDTVIDPTEYDVSYSNNTNAGTGKVTVTDKDGGNYVIGTADTTFTIKPAKGGSLGTAERSQKYTYTQNFTYTPDDWSKLPKNQTFSYSSTYSVSEGSNAVLTCRDISDDGTLTYAISGGKAGDKVVITLRAHCGNYEDFTVTLNVTLLKRNEQAALVVKGDTTVVYGQTLTLTAEGGSGTGEVTYSIDKANSDGDATIDPATGVLTPVKVGFVSVIATKAGDKDYNDVIGAPFMITITQAESVGEPNYTKITTSGKKLKDAALTADDSTLDPNVGTLEWVDDNGNVLPDDTKVVANTIYKWRFTPDDSNYTTLSGAVELYHHVPGGVFYYSYYTIKATAGDGGAVSPSGDVRVREGRDQTFTITPDEDHVIADVKIDGKSIGAVESYTFENVGKAHTIEVSFAKAGDITEADRFADIADGSYYEDAVDWAVKSGITKGTDNTHFSPNGICTRAQAVTFLWRAAGSPEPESDVMPFTDVTADSYYYNAVLWAVENGITKGTDDTVFSPDMTCSRAQIVTFLWRFEKSPSVGTVNPFTDVKSDAYYADAVLWAVSEDITNGTSDTAFSPDADCTRAQIVTFLWRCKK